MHFCVPPSPSQDVARARVAPLARLLAALDVVVEVAPSYAALGDWLLAGRSLVAWAPPIVCARVEMAGGQVVLRAVRGGATTYRAAIVCRAEAEIDWAKTADLVAAWVDEDSAAGFLLARSWLASRRIDAIHGFRRALFTGSYVSSLQAVADRRADITSVFLSGTAEQSHSTLDEVEQSLRDRLRIAVTTGETQTDGIAIAPNADPSVLRPLLDLLAGLSAQDEGRRALKSALQCDELRPAPPRPTSLALQSLLSLEERPQR